ncbi:hypothetical protein OAO01_09255, partial [Oligoflexia bacterium]|nr:hypothetical protein [Oligoflexia bacterium]
TAEHVRKLPLPTAKDMHAWIEAERRLKWGNLRAVLFKGLHAFPLDEKFTPRWLMLAVEQNFYNRRLEQITRNYLKRYPEDENTNLISVSYRIKRKEYAKAIKLLEKNKAEKFSPAWLKLLIKAKWEIAKRKHSAYDSREFLEILSLYRHLLETAPDELDAYIEIAKLLLKLDEVHTTQWSGVTPAKTQALDYRLAALQFDDEDLSRHLAVLEVLVKISRFDLAENFIQDLPFNSADNADLASLTARLNVAQHDLEAACTNLHHGLEMDEHHSACLATLARCAQINGDPVSARKPLQRILSDNGNNNFESYKALGRLEYQLGSFARCKDHMHGWNENGSSAAWRDELSEAIRVREERLPVPNNSIARSVLKYVDYDFKGYGKGSVLAAIVCGEEDLLGIEQTRASLKENRVAPKRIVTCTQSEFVLPKGYQKYDWLLVVRAGVELQSDAILQFLENRRPHCSLIYAGVEAEPHVRTSDVPVEDAAVVMLPLADVLDAPKQSLNGIVNYLAARLNSQHVPEVVLEGGPNPALCLERKRSSLKKALVCLSADIEEGVQSKICHAFKVEGYQVECWDVNHPETSLREHVLSQDPDLVYLYDTNPGIIFELVDLKADLIWDLELLDKAPNRTFISRRKQLKKEFELGLGLASAILVNSVEVSDWLEAQFGVSVQVKQSLETALSVLTEPVLIGVGAGLGNILQASPLIRKLAEHLGHPVDVFIESFTPEAVTLLGRSKWTNIVYSGSSLFEGKRYDKAFITFNAGHLIPPLNCDNVVVQRHQYNLLVECQELHETSFYFLGLNRLFPEIEVSAEEQRRCFLGDFSY